MTAYFPTIAMVRADSLDTPCTEASSKSYTKLDTTKPTKRSKTATIIFGMNARKLSRMTTNCERPQMSAVGTKNTIITNQRASSAKKAVHETPAFPRVAGTP